MEYNEYFMRKAILLSVKSQKKAELILSCHCKNAKIIA